MRTTAKWIWLFLFVAFVGVFLFADTSGLIGGGAVTSNTAVAEVNGNDILYTRWQERVSQAIQNQQRSGAALTQDEVRQIENEVLQTMIMEVLLEEEYGDRGITVTDEEVQEFARYAPPPFMYNNPELQTEGRFDPQKYQRFLSSPQARQSGILLALESYYRTEIPKEKLFQQVTDGIYVTDAELWRSWQDERDSSQVSHVAWRPQVDSATLAAVTDPEISEYFDNHREEFERPGQAWLSVVRIPRVIGAADTAATRARLAQLRQEIVGGAKFEDVARRESVDTVSGSDGGNLGRGGRGRFVQEFETAAYQLRAGEISEPVLTPFGFHLIKVDERKGDTLALRHILLRIRQSDSAATVTDRQADELARIASGADNPAQLDTAARQLGLQVLTVPVVEDRPASLNGMSIPSVSAWAFGGATRGEISELFDDESGYWMARLDSISPGGEPRLDRVRDEIRERLAIEKSLDRLLPAAQEFSKNAAASGFDVAARNAGLTVTKTPMFTRLSFVPGLPQFSKVIGAAFGLPVGAVSAPIRDETGIYVIRVDRRVNADRAAFDQQKNTLRAQRIQQLRQQRLQLFLDDLRKSAEIEDHRGEINAALRRLQVP
ncbi:MAG: peptidyl-prolyl cis-trans isomerase [Gemmatimonadaceae bacterium]